MNVPPTRVAIVDDDPTYGRAAARLLRAYGLDVLTFRSAEAFLDARDDLAVDCHLLDVHLGGMSGFDLQRRLADSGSRAPVVFITGDTGAALDDRAAAAGCALLRKSDPGAVVVATLRKAVEEAGLPHGAVADDGRLPHLSH